MLPHAFASSGSRKPSRLPLAAAVVAALMGTGFWYANRPELAQYRAQAREAQQSEQGRTADEARLVEEQRKRDEIARLVEEERARDEAARLVEEQPKPDEVARLVEEQRERDEVARFVEEQRKEEEELTAKRNRLSRARGG